MSSQRWCSLGFDAMPGGDALSELVESYKLACYRFVGRHLETARDEDLSNKLAQSGLAESAGHFRALILVSALAAALVALPLLELVLTFAFGLDHPLIVASALALLVGGLVAAAFPFVLSARVENRRGKLEAELPFSLSELAVLASIGLSPIELIRRMAQRDHDAAMTSEFRRVAYKADMQGMDLITALAETAKESASPMVRQVLWDFANMIHQGGDLDAYLRQQSDEVLEHKRVVQKQFIDKLGTYSDIYITVVLIGIIFVSVGVFLLDAFSMTAGGLGADTLLLLLTFGVVPVVTIVLAILLGTAHQKAGA
jgi:pilus assembly protein TadC